jgi:hypothetical protein
MAMNDENIAARCTGCHIADLSAGRRHLPSEEDCARQGLYTTSDYPPSPTLRMPRRGRTIPAHSHQHLKLQRRLS